MILLLIYVLPFMLTFPFSLLLAAEEQDDFGRDYRRNGYWNAVKSNLKVKHILIAFVIGIIPIINIIGGVCFLGFTIYRTCGEAWVKFVNQPLFK